MTIFKAPVTNMIFPCMIMKISPLSCFFFALKTFVGKWSVNDVMHGIFTHENIWVKFYFSCMKFPFS